MRRRTVSSCRRSAQASSSASWGSRLGVTSSTDYVNSRRRSSVLALPESYACRVTIAVSFRRRNHRLRLAAAEAGYQALYPAENVGGISILRCTDQGLDLRLDLVAGKWAGFGGID